MSQLLARQCSYTYTLALSVATACLWDADRGRTGQGRRRQKGTLIAYQVPCDRIYMHAGSKLSCNVAVTAKVLFLVCVELRCLAQYQRIICCYAAQRC